MNNKAIYFYVLGLGIILLFNACNLKKVESETSQIIDDSQKSINNVVEEIEDLKQTVKNTKNKMEETVSDVENAVNKVNEAKKAIDEITK